MKRTIACLLACCASLAAHAEEGMWTFDNPPRAAIKEAYGVELTDPWLKRLRLATLRLEQGCTASFISHDGLILTNHHCGYDAIQGLTLRKFARYLVYQDIGSAGVSRDPAPECSAILGSTKVTPLPERSADTGSAASSPTKFFSGTPSKFSRSKMPSSQRSLVPPSSRSRTIRA